MAHHLPPILVALLTLVVGSACAPATPVTPTPEPSPTPAFQGLRLPEPTGPYAVGRQTFALVDHARQELHTPESGDRRALTVHIWYPAEPEPGALPGPYMDPRLAEAFELDEDANAWLGHAVQDAPLADTGGPLPVVLFNQGFNAMPELYAVLLEELASHGYAVAASSHSYADQWALDGNGEVVAYPGDGEFVAGWNGGDPYQAETYLVWVPDTLYVLLELGQLSDEHFDGRLDTERIALLGHSFGGGVSAETCRILAERCAGAVNYDGSHPARLQEVGMPVPYLYFAAARSSSATADEVRRMVEGAQADVGILEIEDVTHYAFGDGYYVGAAKGEPEEELRRRYGFIDPGRTATLMRNYTLAFLNDCLRGIQTEPLEALAERDPEVRLEMRHLPE